MLKHYTQLFRQDIQLAWFTQAYFEIIRQYLILQGNFGLIIQMLDRTHRKEQCLASIVTQFLAQAIETMAEYPLIKGATVTIEILILIFLITQQNLASFPQVKSIGNLIGGGSQSMALFWVYNGITVSLLLSLIGVVFKPVNTSIRRWAIICYISLQVICLLYQVNAVAIFARQIVIFPLSAYILFLPISLFLLDLQLDHHLFGQLSIPILAAEAIVPFQVWKAVVFIFTIRFFYKARNIQLKYGYIALVLVQLWAFSYPEVSNKRPLELLNPLLTLTIALAATIYLRESLMTEEKHSYLLGLVQQAKSNNKNPNEALELSMKQKIKMIEIIESSKIKYSADIFLNIEDLEDAILSGRAKVTDILKLLGCISDFADEKWVRAQIQIHKNTNILKIFKLIGQINPEGIDQTIKLQSLKIKAQDSTHLKSIDNINVKLVQEVNISLQCFYEHLYWCVKGLLSFWRAVQGPSIKASVIADTLQQVMMRKQKARACLQDIKKTYPCKPESKLLNQIERLVSNYWQQTNIQQKQVLSNQNSKGTFNYMVIEERQIKQISSNLLVDLDLTSESKFALKEEDVVPSSLISIIYEQYQQYAKKEFYLPLVVKSKLIVKKATIHMVPSYTSTLQYLILVEPLQVQQAFLYDAHNDQILYFTQKIQVETLGSTKLELVRCIPKAVFNIQFNHDNLQTLKKGNHLSCELNRHFQQSLFPSLDPSNQVLKLSLHFLAEYQSKNSHFVLMEMKSTAGAVSFGTKVTAKAREIRQDSMDKSDKLKLYKDQTNFCRIKNPYSENIREKIQNHQRNRSLSNSSILSILACLVLGACITSLIFVGLLSKGRRDNYLVFLEEGRKLNIEYQNLMKLYYDSQIRYFTKTCSDKVLQWRPQFDLQSSQSYYTTSINSTINTIMEEEFANPLQDQKLELSYRFKYDLFNISASTRKNDIVGLLQEAKKYLTTYNITFMVANYDQIRQIQTAYRISSIVSNKIAQYPSKSYLVVELGLPIIAALTVLLYIVLVHTKRIIDRIYSYAPRITSSQQSEAVNKIEKIMRNHPILLLFDSGKSQSCIETVQNRSDDSQPLIGGAETSKKIQSESMRMFLIKNYIFGLLLLLITVAGVSYLSYVSYQTGNLGQVMSYMQKMQSSSDFALTEITDALNAVIWKYTFNTTNIYGLTDTFLIKTQLDYPLPSYFDSYAQLQTQILYKDLCLTSDRISAIQYFKDVNCTQIFNGALTKGYSIVYENYRYSLTTLRQVPLQNLLIAKSKYAKYPLLIEASYSRRLITGLISDLIIQFVSTSKKYCSYLLKLVITYIQITFILLFVVGLGMALAIYRLKKQCQLALDLVRIIPKDTLSDIKLTKQMVKEQFLLSLERL